MKDRFFARLIKEEDGVAMVVVAVMLVAIMGITSLTVDFGLAYYQQQKLQTALDSAALAASQELPGIQGETNEALKTLKIEKAVEIAKNYMEVYYKEDSQFDRDKVIVTFPEDDCEKYTKVRVNMQYETGTLFAKAFKVYENKSAGEASDFDSIKSDELAAATYDKIPITRIVKRIITESREVVLRRDVYFPYTLFNGGDSIILGNGGYAIQGSVHTNGGVKLSPGNVGDANSPFGDGKSYIYGAVTAVSSDPNDFFVADVWDSTIPPYGASVRQYYNVWSSHAGWPGPNGKDIDGILIGQDYVPMPDYDKEIMELVPTFDETIYDNNQNDSTNRAPQFNNIDSIFSNAKNEIYDAITDDLDTRYSAELFNSAVSGFTSLTMSTGQWNSFYYWVLGGGQNNPTNDVYVPCRYGRPGVAITGDYGNRNHETLFDGSVHFKSGVSNSKKNITVTHGNLYCTGNFIQEQTTTLQVSGNVYIVGNATLGNTDIGGSLYVTGNLTQINNSNISTIVEGDVQVGGNVSFKRAVDIGDNLLVEGNLNQAGVMKVHDNVCCEGDFVQGGGTTAAIVSDNCYIGGTTTITGVATVNSILQSFTVGENLYCDAAFTQSGSTFIRVGYNENGNADDDTYENAYINGSVNLGATVFMDGSLFVKGDFVKGGGNVITIGKDIYAGGNMGFGGGLTLGTKAAGGGILYCGKSLTTYAGNPINVNGVLIAEKDMRFGGMPININETGQETLSIYSRHGGVKFEQSSVGTEIYGMVYAPGWSYTENGTRYNPEDDPDGNGIKNGEIEFGSGSLNFHGSVIGDHLELYSGGTGFRIKDNKPENSDYRPYPFQESYTETREVETEISEEATEYIAKYGLSE